VTVLDEHIERLRQALDRLPDVEASLQAAAGSIARSLGTGGKLLAAGNGGSAAEAQHLTAEFVGRLDPKRDRQALAAVALHADTSALTAVGNDYGFDRVFSRQVEALGCANDVLVVFSTSGASPNLVRAVEAASDRGMTSVGLLGPGSRPLHERCTHVVAVPAESPQAVQECHLVLAHALVEMVEDLLSDTSGSRRRG
jgi:D-sedoheptulose 7-phosphate isomerase